jgi:nickel/cobalt transporter (NiCoT) family protein
MRRGVRHGLTTSPAGRTAALAYFLLIAGNVAAWLWALAVFGERPVLLGTAFLAYSFGLRHGFDADHIAAIDNVTRKLMQEGGRPVSAGLFFALGHSTVVVGLSAAVALGAVPLQDHFAWLRGLGGVIGTSMSALFLLAIAAANTVVLVQVYRAFRAATSGVPARDDADALTAKRGFLVRLFRPVFALVGRSWHMYPLGFLFGLGFDTATEIGLLGIAASQASQGLPIWSILIFPALFTAGMTLIDMTDSVMMVGAYGWAFVRPIRKLYYNLTITFVSVVAALFLGGIEALSLIGDAFALQGRFWELIGQLGDNYGALGYGIVAFFMGSWLVSVLAYKAKGYDRLTAPG